MTAHTYFECEYINLSKARPKFEEGYCIHVNTYMYKPLQLKTKEILNVKVQCHKKDVEKATSLICSFLKSVYAIVKNYGGSYIFFFISRLFNHCICVDINVPVH